MEIRGRLLIGVAIWARLEDAADALLYLGPPESLSTIQMPASELAGTAYGAELQRRQKLQMSLEK
jgi:hypothetical protein